MRSANAPRESVTRTVKVNVPAVVGVPVIRPGLSANTPSLVGSPVMYACSPALIRDAERLADDPHAMGLSRAPWRLVGVLDGLLQE